MVAKETIEFLLAKLQEYYYFCHHCCDDWGCGWNWDCKGKSTRRGNGKEDDESVFGRGS